MTADAGEPPRRQGQPSTQHRHVGASRLLHRIASVTAGERAAVVVAVVVATWLLVYAASGFPEWMATALEVAAAATTLVMVFVIQHTQQRVERATQLKLDELVRASDASDDVAAIERRDDDGLERAHADGGAPRRAAAPRRP